MKRNLTKRNTRRIALVVLAIILSFSLAACGGGESFNIADEFENEIDGGGSASDGELVIGIPGSLSSLDVNQEAGILNYYVGAIVNEGLLSIGNNGKIVPALAESYEHIDAHTWIFKLRADAKFSDGSPVTAEDVIWSIERAMDPQQSPGVSIYFPTYVESIRKTADDEITIELDGSHASFIWAISNAGGLFVNKKEWGEAAGTIGSPQDLLLGSGPYKAVEFTPGSHATFVANEYWWGGAPNIGRIRFDFIEDESTSLLAFTNGDIDFALNIPVEQGEQWEGVPGAAVEYIADRSYYGITFDETVAPFDDVHVRRAVAHAIDKDSILHGSIIKSHGQIATAITPPEQFAVALSVAEANTRLAAVTHYNFDLEKAKEELASSKVPDGFKTTIRYPDAYQNTGRVSLVIADTLKELGIELEVQEIPLDQWLNEVGDGEQGMAWMIYFPTTAEPAEIVSWLLDGTGPGWNPANWTNAEAADLVAAALSSDAMDGQVGPVLEAEDLAGREAIYAPIWWGQSAVAFNSNKVTLSDYNSFSLISQNWPSLFSLS